jgi:uncharacterized membrane protein SpoIIM required for sporulation
VDIETFSAAHAPIWQRLGELTKRRRLTGAEADELVRLYQRTATHLSQLRSAAPDPDLVSQLSITLAAAQAKIAGAHESSWSVVRRFAEATVPVALYRIRWWSLGVTAACVLLGIAAGFWVVHQPDALAMLGTRAERQAYVDDAFTQYYSEFPHPSFSASVWTNNAFIAVLCVATGITGLFPAFVLFQNAVAVGAMGGLMWSHGAQGVFFQMILPHGLLELTAVFVAGAAGLHLFWTWLVPGPRPRARALAQEGRATIAVAVALTLALAVSGVIEGFVTPSSLPWWIKIAIGAIAAGAFWAGVFALGRRAARAGWTAEAEDAERYIPVAG